MEAYLTYKRKNRDKKGILVHEAPTVARSREDQMYVAVARSRKDQMYIALSLHAERRFSFFRLITS